MLTPLESTLSNALENALATIRRFKTENARLIAENYRLTLAAKQRGPKPPAPPNPHRIRYAGVSPVKQSGE